MSLGPWATQLLGDLGADIIKVEKPHEGDDTRKWGPPFLKGKDNKDTTESAYYLAANRNKRSITCDFTKPQGQAVIHKLVAQSDVFVENFRVGHLAKYNLDYASVKAINPCEFSQFC
jgi:crotonobetainyl-CoA:carnitine CoA-transferase CaiB-like acyl-CoA transferase